MEQRMEGKKMSFSKALKKLKKGEYLTRRRWNGKGQYICLARMTECELATGDIIIPGNEHIGNKFIMFVGTSGYQCGWLASQADMLANDWEVVA